jgi:hypothetical protein
VSFAFGFGTKSPLTLPDLVFERALADPVDPAIASAEIASELRRGADYVRVTVALTVVATDVADALAIAWNAFRGAAGMTSPAGR